MRIDLDKNLHGADENGSKSLDLLEATDEDITVDLMRELLLAGVNFARYASKTRTQILDKLHQILHTLDDLCNVQIVEHFLALADDFAHFRLVKAKQQRGSALQNTTRSLNQLPPIKHSQHKSNSGQVFVSSPFFLNFVLN